MSCNGDCKCKVEKKKKSMLEVVKEKISELSKPKAKKSKEGTGVRYRTYNINHTTEPDSPANGGKITVCTNDLGEGKLEIGVCFCSPKDHYEKPYGQMVAYGRMESERTKRVIPKWDDDLPVNDRLKMEVLQIAGEMGKGKGVQWLENVMSIDLV